MNRCQEVTVNVKGKDVTLGKVTNKGTLELLPEYVSLYGMLKYTGNIGSPSYSTETFYLPIVSKTVIECNSTGEGIATLIQEDKRIDLPANIYQGNSFYISFSDLLTTVTWDSDENVTLMFASYPDDYEERTYDPKRLLPITDVNENLVIQSGTKGVIKLQNQGSFLFVHTSNKCKVKLIIKVAVPPKYYFKQLERGVKQIEYITIQREQVAVSYLEPRNKNVVFKGVYPNFKKTAQLAKNTFKYYSVDPPVVLKGNDLLKDEEIERMFVLLHGFHMKPDPNSRFTKFVRNGGNVKTQNDEPATNYLSGDNIRVIEPPNGYMTVADICVYINSEPESYVEIYLYKERKGPFASKMVFDLNDRKQEGYYFYSSARFFCNVPSFWINLLAGGLQISGVVVRMSFIKRNDSTDPILTDWNPFSRELIYLNPTERKTFTVGERTTVKTFIAAGGGGSGNSNSFSTEIATSTLLGSGGGEGETFNKTLYSSKKLLYNMYAPANFSYSVGAGGTGSSGDRLGTVNMPGEDTVIYSDIYGTIRAQGGGTSSNQNGGSPGGGGSFLKVDSKAGGLYYIPGKGGSEGYEKRYQAGEDAKGEKAGNGGLSIPPQSSTFPLDMGVKAKGKTIQDGGQGGGASGVKIYDNATMKQYYCAYGGTKGVSNGNGGPGIICVSCQYFNWNPELSL